MECHERKRPANHYVGQNCVNCHNVAGHVGVDWRGATGMPHGASGSTTGSTLACATCHGQGGSANTKLTVATTAHMGGGLGTSCIGCHKNFAGFSGSTTNVLYSHSGGTYGTGLNTPDCKICHNFVNGTYRSYTNSTWSLSQTTVMPTQNFDGDTFSRNHTVTTADQNMSNCLACHRYSGTTTQTPAQRWAWRHNAPSMTKTQGSQRLGCAVCHEHQ
jgi:nitrate/TMAO reductase-like tetraheme cytochrome c subunit